jgi:pimeloyl-ACP methyl ester carboxylesterase
VNEDVVLVHGLWMPAAAMALLAGRLARRGYRTHFFAYRGRAPFEANVERLAAYARRSLRGRPAHYVGHSLGGVLVMEMLLRHPQVPARSAVLLGAPVRGCHAGRQFGLSPLGRWMMGGSRPRWLECAPAWTRPEPLGIIAGSVPLGLGRSVGRLPGPNDGVVCVDETAVDGMRAQRIVPLSHSMLIFSARVAQMTGRFFACGEFA